MTNPDLAALSEAATQGVPVTGNDWLRQFSDDRQLADVLLALYHAGQLVLIGPDAVERAARAMMAHVGFEWVDGPEEERSLLNKHEARALATAALAALGVK